LKSGSHPKSLISAFWLNAQRAVDLWNAERENKQEIEKITPLQAAV
jgi:plasmid maintenance system antidote protein VapI